MPVRVKNGAYGFIGFAFSLVGLAELVAALRLAVLLLVGGEVQLLALMVLLVQGGAFAAIGLVIYLPYRKNLRRRKRLMQMGDVYDAQVAHVHKKAFFIAGVRPVVAECRYWDKTGQGHLVKSPYLWPVRRSGRFLQQYDYRPEEFAAKVYVNPHNPQDCHAEAVVLRSAFATWKARN